MPELGVTLHNVWMKRLSPLRHDYNLYIRAVGDEEPGNYILTVDETVALYLEAWGVPCVKEQEDEDSGHD